MNSSQAKQTSNNRLSTILARLVLILILTVSVAACLLKIDQFPSFVDPDTATDGIFINNLMFGRDFDFPFGKMPEFQNQYRSWYATERLPLTLPLAAVGHYLIPDSHYTLFYMQLVSVIFALLGCQAFCKWGPAQNLKTWEKLALVSWTLLFPAFFVPLRLSFPAWFLAFSLFWIALGSLLEFFRSKNSKYLLYFAISTGYFLLNPYPPLLVLVTSALIITFSAKARWKTVISRTGILALIFTITAVFAVGIGSAKYVGLSTTEYWNRLMQFHGTRAFSVTNLPTPGSALMKSHKLINQHLLFVRDKLGDQSRPDGSETLGELHWPAISAALVILFSIFAAIRRGSPNEKLALIICSVGVVIALTISFPQGRYLLYLIPIYGYFFLLGARKIFSSELRRIWAVNLYLLCSLCATLLSYTSNTTEYILLTQRYQDGVRQISSYLAGRGAYASKSTPLTYESWLVLGMLDNFQSTWLPKQTFFEQAAQSIPQANDKSYYFFKSQPEIETSEKLSALRFAQDGEIVTPALHHSFEIWVRQSEKR